MHFSMITIHRFLVIKSITLVFHLHTCSCRIFWNGATLQCRLNRFLTCRLWWQSFLYRVRQTRPTKISFPGARWRSVVWDAEVSWTAHLCHQETPRGNCHQICMSDHLLRSSSPRNAWHNFRNFPHEFLKSHPDIHTSQNHKKASQFQHSGDKLKQKIGFFHWKKWMEIVKIMCF